jgi:hypothetical protein
MAALEAGQRGRGVEDNENRMGFGRGGAVLTCSNRFSFLYLPSDLANATLVLNSLLEALQFDFDWWNRG